MIKFLFLTAASFMMCSSIFSQSINNYSFSASSGSFTALSSPTNISFSNNDDAFSGAISIGFDFWYMGTRYTQLFVATNGFITFNSNPDPANVNNSNNFTNINSTNAPLIAALWEDILVGTGSYKLTGTSPNQIFTIEWLNVRWDANAGSASISFQVKLYETSGKIEFIYRQESGSVQNNGAGGASIGLGITSGTYISLNGTGSNPTASTSTSTNNLLSKPATGQTYEFTPSAPSAPNNLTFTSIGSTDMTLNWQDNSSNELGFAIYRSTDGVNFTYVTTTSSNATSSVQSSLSASQNYTWNIYAVKEALSSALSGSQSTLPVELSSFNFKINNNNVILSWITIFEINNFKIEVERNDNNSINNWNTIGSIQGHGNSNTPIEYSFIDKNIKPGTYNYRLKQIDYNGNYEYHYLNQNVLISVPNDFNLSQNYPNPFNPITVINYSIPYSQNVKLILYDVLGKQLAILFNELKDAGSYEYIFNASDFPSGIYYYRIVTTGFSKSFKMSLLK